MHRAEIFDCLLESRLIGGVARGCVGFGMARILREVIQASPHKAMEIRDPERNYLAQRQIIAQRREGTYIVQQ